MTAVSYHDLARRLDVLERELCLQRTRSLFHRLDTESLTIPLRMAKDLERLHALLLAGHRIQFATIISQLGEIEAAVLSAHARRSPT